jgi:hypothetical protein
MKDISLDSGSLKKEESKAIDEIDLIIGDASSLKKVDSSASEERKELGVRQISQQAS